MTERERARVGELENDNRALARQRDAARELYWAGEARIRELEERMQTAYELVASEQYEEAKRKLSLVPANEETAE